MQKPPIIHSITPAEGSHFLKTEILDLEFSNGERRIYERLKSSGSGAVIIVAMRDENTVLLVREYGAGLDRYELGLYRVVAESLLAKGQISKEIMKFL